MDDKPAKVTDAELAVLQALWERGPATVRQLTDAVYPGGYQLHLRVIGAVGGDEFLSGAQICRLTDIACTAVRIDAFEQFAKTRSDVACGSGNKDFLH